MKNILIITISFLLLSCNDHQTQQAKINTQVEEAVIKEPIDVDNNIMDSYNVTIYNNYINNMHYLIFKSTGSYNFGNTTVINLTKDSLEAEYYKKYLNEKK